MEEATELLREVALFPYKWDATGRCEKLNENNRCVVYDKRPAICSISSNWKKHHSEIPLLEYYKRAAAACNAMIEAAGLDETFKVHI
jgi:Fe-S-cluster containining protein